MTTAIVLIPVDYPNGFEIAQKVRNQAYKTTTALRIQLAMELVKEDEADAVNDVEIYDIEDFMTGFNDESINTIGTWMTYVRFE